MKIDKEFKEIKEQLSIYKKINEALSLIYWDMRTKMPEKAGDSRAEIIQYLSGESFKCITGEEVLNFINVVTPYKKDLNKTELRILEELERTYNESSKIPKERYVSFVGACSKSELAWERAKEKNDFEIFKPHLKSIIGFQKEFIEYWGYKDNKYDTLLDKYEIGLTVEKLDKVFKELKEGIIEILNKIKNSNKAINRDCLIGNFDIKKQRKLSLDLLKDLGFDLKAGRLDESVHPFTIEIGNKDVRLTTNYHEKDITSALFSTIHECGHGIYEQNISDDLEDTGLQTGVSMAIHESQSRFYENIIGRSKEFCEYLLPVLKRYFENLKDVNLDEFYEAINYVEPSLIRTEADELTYSLHIIIRYEIEKELINGKIEIEDLKNIWNQKYKEYLGIEPSSDSEGILQDMHWSDGSFGYFPSYALGNLYGAQIFNKLLQDNPNVMVEVAKGNFSYINKWLKDNIHIHGSIYKPHELIKNITGEELSAKYFIEFLKNKYYKIYDIKE